MNWDDYRDLFGATSPRLWKLEAEATRIRNFQPTVVPGLLQTAEYRAAIWADSPKEHGDLDRYLEVLSARQRVLERDDVQLEFVIDESIVHRPVGEQGLLSRQMEHIKELCERPNITVGVLPFVSRIPPNSHGPFVIVDSGERYVYREAFRESSLTHEDNNDTTWCIDRFSKMMERSVAVGDVVRATAFPL